MELDCATPSAPTAQHEPFLGPLGSSSSQHRRTPGIVVKMPDLAGLSRLFFSLIFWSPALVLRAGLRTGVSLGG